MAQASMKVRKLPSINMPSILPEDGEPAIQGLGPIPGPSPLVVRSLGKGLVAVWFNDERVLRQHKTPQFC